MIRQGAMEKFSYVAMRKVPRPGFERDTVVPSPTASSSSSPSGSGTSPYPVNRHLSKSVSFSKDKTSKNEKSQKLHAHGSVVDTTIKQSHDNWTLSDKFM